MQVLGLIDVPWWGLLITGILTYLLYSCRHFNYFRKQGIKGPMPLPIFGTLFYSFKKSLQDEDVAKVKEYEDQGVCGEFFGSTPSLVVFDEKLLSEIMVKEFTSFINRVTFKTDDPISDYMLGNLDNEHWKHVRTEMTPTFTTGKLKQMNSEINRCSSILAEALLERAKLHETVEMKEYTGGYAMDAIASTSFGIRVDSQKDRNDPFVTNAKAVFENFNTSNPIMFLRVFFPELCSVLMKLGLQMQVFSKESLDFFSNITEQTMKMRKSDVDQSKVDFIQLMINKERGGGMENKDDDQATEHGSFNQGLTTDEIVANAIIFFIAGYDTTATSLSFLLYNLAVNQDCQDKLVQEIQSVVGNEDFVDYSLLQDMPYLDQCINENLRISPPATRTNRMVEKDTTINGIFFKKGTIVEIPMFAIQHDPKKWPNPEKFNPERFTAANKKDRNPYHFLPFGYGPRNCIGMRLALMELKVAAIHVLRKVMVTPCEKTEIPIKYAKDSVLLTCAGGNWLKMEPRDQ